MYNIEEWIKFDPHFNNELEYTYIVLKHFVATFYLFDQKLIHIQLYIKP